MGGDKVFADILVYCLGWEYHLFDIFCCFTFYAGDRRALVYITNY